MLCATRMRSPGNALGASLEVRLSTIFLFVAEPSSSYSVILQRTPSFERTSIFLDDSAPPFSSRFVYVIVLIEFSQLRLLGGYPNDETGKPIGRFSTCSRMAATGWG
jgi:hypothetical protein